MTGSAGLGLATGAEIPFVQEVNSAFIAVKERIPDADAVIELGGEDAKIIFLTGGVEQRMNGSCARRNRRIYRSDGYSPWSYCYRNGQYVALCSKSLSNRFKMRCICKIRIQPLLNQGAKREDICASIFQAVVDQTVSVWHREELLKVKFFSLAWSAFIP